MSALDMRPIDVRPIVGTLFASLSFLLSLTYFGPGINLAVGLYSLVFLTLAFLSQPLHRLAFILKRHQYVSTFTALFVFLLVFHHLFISVSPDSSFVPSVVLAVIPLSMLLGLLLSPQRLFGCLFWIVFGCAAYAAGDFLINQTRAYFPLADPNNFVTVLYLVWIPWLHRALLRKIEPDALTFAGVALVNFVFVVALSATASRFALLVVGCICIYWILAFLFRKITSSSLASLLIGVGLALFTFTLFARATGVEVEGLSQTVASELSDGSHRLQMLASAWQIVLQQSGLTGSGVYTFSLLYPGTRSVLEQTTTGLFLHNDYVQLFLEGGLFLALPVLGFLGWLASCWFKSFAASNLWLPRNGFLLAVSFTALHAVVNFTFYILPIAFLLGVGLANLISPATSEEAQDGDERASVPLILRLGLIGFVLFGLAINAFFALEAMNYAVFSAQKGMPWAAEIRSRGSRQADYARLSLALNADRGIPKFALARLAAGPDSSTLNDLQKEEVKRLYTDALAADPFNPQVWFEHARFLVRIGESSVARRSLEEAIALNPIDVGPRLMAMQLALQLGDLAAAERIALEGTVWCELIARRSPDDLHALGRSVSQLQAQLESVVLEEGLDGCRHHRQHTRATKRKSGFLINLFKPG